MVKDYAGNHVDSLQTTTDLVGSGGITSNIEIVIVPTARRVCLGTVHRKLVRAFVGTKTVISAPAYKPYLNKCVKILTGKRGTISAAGEGFIKEVNRPNSRVCLTSPCITTTSTLAKCLASPRSL